MKIMLGMAILISDKVYWKSKLTRRDKEVHCIFTTEIIHQEYITTSHVYIPNFEVFNFIKQMLNAQKLTDCDTAIVDGFNTTPSSWNKSFKPKISKETADIMKS